MREGRCVCCGAHFATPAKRERIVRKWAAALARTAGYPLMYRLVERLPLCAGCLDTMPVIGDEMCWQCGREWQQEWKTAGKPGREPGKRLCRDCLAAQPSALRGNRSLLRYQGWGKELLGRYKYRGDERLAQLFALLLMIAMHRHYQPDRINCLTAVPLHAKRLRERGFNQMELIAERVSRACGIPARPLLERTKETKKLSQQTGRAARRQSIQGAFAMKTLEGSELPEHRIPPCTILLLDDVYTTGSTLRECAAAIQRAQTAEVHIFSLTIYR